MTKNNLELITSSLGYFESNFASDFINNFSDIKTSMKKAIIYNANKQGRELLPYLPCKEIMKERSITRQSLHRD